MAGTKVPMAYNPYARVGNHEDVLDAHTRMIEEAIQATILTRLFEEQEALNRKAQMTIPSIRIVSEKSPALPELRMSAFEMRDAFRPLSA